MISVAVDNATVVDDAAREMRKVGVICALVLALLDFKEMRDIGIARLCVTQIPKDQPPATPPSRDNERG